MEKERKEEDEGDKGKEGKESERKNRRRGEKRLRYPQSSEVQTHPVSSHRFVVPVCATRCGLTQKDPQSGSRVTERAGKGKIRRQQQAGGKTKNRPAYIELACDDDDDRGGGGYDDEVGTHT